MNDATLTAIVPKTVGELRSLTIESLKALLTFCEAHRDGQTQCLCKEGKADWARRVKLVAAVLKEKQDEATDEHWSALADIMEG